MPSVSNIYQNFKRIFKGKDTRIYLNSIFSLRSLFFIESPIRRTVSTINIHQYVTLRIRSRFILNQKITILRLVFFYVSLTRSGASGTPTAPPLRQEPPSSTAPTRSSDKQAPAQRKARVLYDFDAGDSTELSLLADEVCTSLFSMAQMIAAIRSIFYMLIVF